MCVCWPRNLKITLNPETHSYYAVLILMSTLSLGHRITATTKMDRHVTQQEINEIISLEDDFKQKVVKKEQ